MDDPMPSPLNARMITLMRSQSTSSTAYYPQIPRRQSSLSASLSDGTSGQAVSTRTPSLSESLYQIRVVKIREQNARALSNGYDPDDPFVDKNPQLLTDEQQAKHPMNRYRALPRLTIRWSSGSWDSSGQSVPSNPASGSLQSRAPTPQIENLELNQFSQVKSAYISSMDLPVAFVDVKSTTSSPQIGLGAMSLWTTVHVSADVTSVPFPGTSGLAPLDAIVVLDRLSQPSVNLLAQITLGPSVLASNLMHNHDRIAIVCVNGMRKHGFEILLPLGFHSLDTVRSALNRFSQRQHPMKHGAPLNLGNAIQQVANMFCTSTRPAFCHLFFVSATPPDHLLIPWIDQAIGFHTITPKTCLPVTRPNFQAGWHISYDVATGDLCPHGAHFIRKVSKVIRHLRTGIRPGSISDLKLSLSPGHGCLIQTVIDSTRLTSIRPGETWVVPVRIHIPNAFPPASLPSESPVQSPILGDLFAQINELLEEFTGEITQPILTASVDYRHSLLPTPNLIHAETQLTVVRMEDSRQFGKPNVVVIEQGEELVMF
ncbi:uncharacterized protein N7496_011650 [Penicillium cataractarum]|uniref:Uncharacterized protein n=1 Tax=Penicillium cataractarum TaxID=2100454 RepID=A0A9W9RFV7_9EURO|nr:uncharacterized protein N7496_011650 [Penicillium cataractarum]KAJ5359237.1 hypothetical protein N7496_011650 [Penicillium cataractarum]